MATTDQRLAISLPHVWWLQQQAKQELAKREEDAWDRYTYYSVFRTEVFWTTVQIFMGQQVRESQVMSTEFIDNTRGTIDK